VAGAEKCSPETVDKINKQAKCFSLRAFFIAIALQLILWGMLYHEIGNALQILPTLVTNIALLIYFIFYVIPTTAILWSMLGDRNLADFIYLPGIVLGILVVIYAAIAGLLYAGARKLFSRNLQKRM
jgi:hypothetical protein